VEVTSVKEAVVSLPTAAEAEALFAKFAEQWRICDGTTSLLTGSMFKLNAKTSNVQNADSVVAATVSTGFSSPGSDAAVIPAGRAIGVRGDCLVEVEVDFFNAANRSRQTVADVNAAAIDIAHAMMDNVSALS
jgi:hypothetical protein